MKNIPKIIFTGFSGSGKTTIIEKIVKILSKKGFKVATVKHDVHGLEIDKEGKDSYRFSKAGAITSVVSSKDITVFKEHRELDLNDILNRIKNVDIILIEGYKSETKFDIFGVGRMLNNKGFTKNINEFNAVITDYDKNTPIFKNFNGKIFDINNVDDIALYIIKKYIK